MKNNSQFTTRREIVSGSLPDPIVIDANAGGGEDTGANVTDTTGDDTDTGGDADVTPQDTTKEDDPSTTATVTNSEDLQITECSGYCKMYNVLNIGMSGALILFLLAMSYQAVKSVGKIKAST